MCFKVVPVKITGNCGTKEIITYAFLDSGSEATFCLEPSEGVRVEGHETNQLYDDNS